MNTNEQMIAEMEEHLCAAQGLMGPEFLLKIEQAALLATDTINNGKKLLLFR
ncbi:MULTISPECIES: hypothetical protein [Mucilaginibacter]|uniref:Uncharacterized protein n=1 Tax=Mucilaginibacter rubeus TaxID=2027860 RepID=A0ABX7UIP1_9SPHI|nr:MULTISPECIES: hypothetical protein [Mucilaginibacter]QTE36250.1 hypothetical protein J3L18_24435 [Mucilaginibacter gossypii]QTE44703.1 hypothetical protein J3L19_04860 [Mucilaginibacter rubeus]QTE51301.1 hypothetical protein J3L21_04835 [Mucilaginibacter rubeus]QTE56388.1 hypothetical protein J3L23_30085 [Mucilaginibacter rubeus]QTE64151.1 hypothetical protein J3L22_03750 [Mucilaginibacter rubeus]